MFFGSLRPEKALEYFFVKLFVNANAMVSHFYGYVLCFMAVNGDMDIISMRRVLDRIGKQIDDHLANAILITIHFAGEVMV